MEPHTFHGFKQNMFLISFSFWVGIRCRERISGRKRTVIIKVVIIDLIAAVDIVKLQIVKDVNVEIPHYAEDAELWLFRFMVGDVGDLFV